MTPSTVGEVAVISKCVGTAALDGGSEGVQAEEAALSYKSVVTALYAALKRGASFDPGAYTGTRIGAASFNL